MYCINVVMYWQRCSFQLQFSQTFSVLIKVSTHNNNYDKHVVVRVIV